jgi:hypothetical protein
MIYERGDGPRVEDKTSSVCHRQLGGCAWYLNNRLDGIAREEAIRKFARLKLRSERGEEGEKTMTVDLRVTITCDGPPARDVNLPCQAEYTVKGETDDGEMLL